MLILTELQREKILDHMLESKEALAIKYKAKKNEFENISVYHNEVDDYVAKGFTITKRSARKATVSKKKKTDVWFEDRIWCMFYELGFRILNRDEKLVVPWGPNPEDTKQLDVVAVGDDAIFVVECKAAEKQTSRNFRNEINEMEHYMSGISDSLRQIYGRTKRVKFIFATENYRLQEGGEDIKRMEHGNIYHLNDNSYKYFQSLIKAYQKAVAYQFYSIMFKDELINEVPIRIPVLRGEMGGKKYYIFSIEPSILLKIGFVLHRTKVNDTMAPTYQRLLIPSRLKGITKFIDDGGYFPNSIIINFNAPKEELKVQFTPIKASTDSKSEFGFLNIPNAYGIAFIIDGQHRVFGYAQSQYKDTNTIPVVAFENMPSDEQLKIFMDINENQKAVSPSLRLDLQENLLWNAQYIDSRMKALRSSIVKELNNNTNYALYNKIYVGEDPAILKFEPFDNALKKSELIPKATKTQWKGDTDVSLYNIRETDNEKAMNDCKRMVVQFVGGCYNIAADIMEEKYAADYLFSNRATFPFIVLIGSLNRYLVHTGVINPNSTIIERINAIRPYIEALANRFNIITDEENRTFKGFLGQGAEKKWLCAYEDYVNQSYEGYCPDELIEWKDSNDRELQQQGRDLVEDIKKQLKFLVFSCFEKAYGEKWKSNNDILTLKYSVSARLVQANKDDEDFEPSEGEWMDYIQVQEFRDLIDKNFANPLFENTFAIQTGPEFRTKKEKLAWAILVAQSETRKNHTFSRNDIDLLEIIDRHLTQHATVESGI